MSDIGKILSRPQLIEESVDPSSVAGRVILYGKDGVGGVAQLFARTEDGTIYQLTPLVGGDIEPSSLVIERDPVDSDADALIRYVDSVNGNDGNDGESPGQAWQTLDDDSPALQFLDAFAPLNQQRVLQLANGSSFVRTTKLSLGFQTPNAQRDSLDFTATGPNMWASRAMRRIRSPVTEIATVVLTGSSVETGSGLRTYNTTSNLVVNAHVGQMLVGSGFAEWGVIRANSAGPNSTVSVTSTLTHGVFTAPVRIVEFGATITIVDPDSSEVFGVEINPLCDWNLSGIRIQSSKLGSAALRVLSGPCKVGVQLCDLEGIALHGPGPSYVAFDACWIHGIGPPGRRFLAIDGTNYILRNCLLTALDSSFHGRPAYSDLLECVWSGNLLSWGGSIFNGIPFAANNCTSEGNGEAGFRVSQGRSVLTNVLSQNNTGAGLEVYNGAKAQLSNLDGTGNTTYGIVRNGQGSEAIRDGASSVTGTLGLDRSEGGARRRIASGSSAVAANSSSNVLTSLRGANELIAMNGWVVEDVGVSWSEGFSDLPGSDAVDWRFFRTAVAQQFVVTVFNRNPALGPSRTLDWAVDGVGV